MDTIYTVLSEIAYLVDGIIDSRLAHIIFIFSVGSNDVSQLLRNGRAGEGDGCSKLLGSGDRHDPRMNRNMYTHPANSIQKTIELCIIKKHLGYK